MSWSPVQLAHARVIVAVVKAMGLPVRCAVIALEVAIDESGIEVLANANNPASLRLPHDGIGRDHASVGIFQQQPGDAPGSTVNWGTTRDCMDPATSAGKFLRALQRVSWRTMTNWQAAQAVQVSSYPDGSNYRRFDGQATALAAQLWSEGGPLMALTDAEQAEVLALTRETHARVMAMLHQNYMVPGTDGHYRPVPASTPGAIPTRVLDQLDGQTILQAISAANPPAATATPGP